MGKDCLSGGRVSLPMESEGPALSRKRDSSSAQPRGKKEHIDGQGYVDK